MQICVKTKFEFSGCDYHPASTFSFEDAEALMCDQGIQPDSPYSVWAFRDLLLCIASEVTADWSRFERTIRDDVRKRRGFANGEVPRPTQAVAHTAM